MIYHDISAYLEALAEWEQTLITITRRGIIVNGKRFPPALYYQNNPKPRYEYELKENYDKTQISKGVIPYRQR